MNFAIFTSPAQIKLVNDLIFDLTGLGVTVNDLVAFGLIAAAIQLALKSPYFSKA